MEKQQVSYWVNAFGQKIYRVHLKTSLPQKGAIGFVHGIGEHIERYRHVFDFYLTQGYSVFGFDSYGHGRSEGIRGHIFSEDQWMDEIEMLVQWMRSCTQTPVVLYGHSLGGLKTLLYLLKSDLLPDLSVVTSPFVAQAIPEWKFKVAVCRWISRFFPQLTVSNRLNVQGISHDLNVVKAYIEDPYNHSQVSLGMAKIMFDAVDWIVSEPFEVSIPLLIEHGTEDLLTSYQASQKLSNDWKGDLSFYSWQGGYHELHNEPNKIEFLEKTLHWLEMQRGCFKGLGS